MEEPHDLAELLDLVLPVEPLWEPSRADMQTLTRYAVVFRYPGDSADKELARDAFQKCRGLRKVIRESLGLKEPRKSRKRG